MKETIMKRTLSFVLTLGLAVSAVPALAQDTEANNTADANVWNAPEDIKIHGDLTYLPVRDVLDHCNIDLKWAKEGQVEKLILSKGEESYQVVLDKKSQLAKSDVDDHFYIHENGRIAFTPDFYRSIFINAETKWDANNAQLTIAPGSEYDEVHIGNLPAYVDDSQSAVQAAPETQATYYESGQATWYGSGAMGNYTASGELFNMYDMTAAHKYLPFGTKVRVTNQANGLSTVVRINDRGPFGPGRVIDLSYAAANQVNMISSGVVPVTIEVLQ